MSLTSNYKTKKIELKSKLARFDAYSGGDILEMLNELRNILFLSIQQDIEHENHRLQQIEFTRKIDERRNRGGGDE